MEGGWNLEGKEKVLWTMIIFLPAKPLHFEMPLARVILRAQLLSLEIKRMHAASNINGCTDAGNVQA